MKQAELIITLVGWRADSSHHCVNFVSADTAKQEFDRITALLKRRADKGNDLPKFLEVRGSNELVCDFDNICAIQLVDLRKADDDAIGLKDAYPHLNWQRP